MLSNRSVERPLPLTAVKELTYALAGDGRISLGKYAIFFSALSESAQLNAFTSFTPANVMVTKHIGHDAAAATFTLTDDRPQPIFLFMAALLRPSGNDRIHVPHRGLR